MKKKALSNVTGPVDAPGAQPDKRWVTKKQVAVALGLDPRTITKMMKEKCIPYIKLFPGKTGDVRFDLDAVREHLMRTRGICAEAA
jgi:hypothetical protein